VGLAHDEPPVGERGVRAEAGATVWTLVAIAEASMAGVGAESVRLRVARAKPTTAPVATAFRTEG